MHPNPAFRQTATEDNLAFARDIGFGVLTVNGPAGPLAAHLPFALSEDGSFAELHLARSNAIARTQLPAPALLAVQGPQHYISPDWYGPHQEVPDQVPTWNYVAVHLRGTLTPLPPESLLPHLDALSAEHERRLAPKAPWRTTKMTQGAMERMMRMILPFRLDIAEIDGTWKLGQNKTDEIRARAASALDSLGELSQASVLARLMRATDK